MATAQARRGIFYGYYMMPGLAIICWMGYWMWLTYLGPLVTPLEREFGWSRAAIGGAYSVGAVTSGFVMPVVGYLIDRFGARRFMFIGAVGVALGQWVLSITTDLWMFYLGWLIIVPLSNFIIYPGVTKIIGNWFAKRRGTMMSIMPVVVAFVYLGTTIIILLIDSYGWRAASQIMGIAVLVSVLPIALFMVRERPEPWGYGPDGVPLAEIAAPTARAEARPAAPAAVAFTLAEGLRTRAIWLFGLCGFAGAFTLYTQTTFQVPYLEEMGIPRVMAGAVMGFMGLMSVPGRFGGGYLADRLGRGREIYVWCGALMLMGLGMFILTQARDLTLVWVFLVVYGPGFGATVPIPMAAIASYYGTASYATLYGIYMFLVRWGSLFAPIGGGYIYDVTGSFLLAFGAGAVMAIIFGFAILLARPPRPKLPAAA